MATDVAVSREEAAGLALQAAERASKDIAGAWALSPGAPGLDLDRARLLVARSRNGSVPASAAMRLAERLDDISAARERAVRQGLALIASATRHQEEADELVRQHRIPVSLTDEQREQLFKGHRPTQEQRRLVAEFGVGPRAVLKLNDEQLRIAESQFAEQLQELVRLRITDEMSAFAGHERQRTTEGTRLAEIESDATRSSASLRAAFANLYRQLRSKTRSDEDVAAASDLLAVKGRQAARELAPLAVGLERWSTPGAELRYRHDHATASVAVAVAIRAALLAFAAGVYNGVAFNAGVEVLTKPWREAARSRPQGAFAVLEGAPSARSLRRVRGMVASIDELKVNQEKEVTILSVLRGQRSISPIVLPFFNPRYVGISRGTIVDLRVGWSADVFAEFTNANTRRRLQKIADRLGGKEGGVVDRRNFGEEQRRSWMAWLIPQVRPMYDAVPDSLNGTWSLGTWFALSVASGTIY